MTYLSDRHRREYVYAIRLIQLTFLGAVNAENALRNKANQICEDALFELLPPADKDTQKLLRAVNKMIDVTLRDYANKASDNLAGEKVVLTTYCLLEMLGECGALNLVTGSPLAELMEFMLGSIDADSELTQKRLKNANKDALRWLGRLREIGYYAV